MALRQTHVDIDFTANADPLRGVNNEINNILINTKKMGGAFGAVDEQSKRMLKDMKDGFKQQRDSMMKWRNDMIGAQYGFYLLSKRAADYRGTTGRMMKSIMALGATHKKATDEMMKNNDRLKMSIYQQIGIMGNMTTAAKKTKDAINLWKNPIYLASMGSLTFLDRLQKIAQNATPAAIALERLGKNANAKELADEIKRLNQGLGALPIAYIGAGLAAFFFYGAIHKAAMKNKEYAKSWTTMKDTLRKAIQPMIDVFIMIMVPVYNFITAIGKLVIKFNEAHPVLAKMIQGVLLLIPALTLLLLPMGLGIGLMAGYRLAFAKLMTMIRPLITLFMTLSPIVWIVAAAIVGLTVAFVYAYNNFAWFRTAVDAVFAWLKASVMSVVNAIKTFINQIITQIKAWWAENHTVVMAAVNKLIAAAKWLYDGFVPIFQLIWIVAKTAVQTAWSLISGIIKTAIGFILGTITFFSQVLTGDWKAAWDTVWNASVEFGEKISDFFQELFDGITNFLSGIDLTDVGADIMMGLWNGMKEIGSKALSYVQELGKSIKKVMSKVLDINSPSREMFKIGAWTVEGQILGMESQQKQLRDMSYTMAAMPMEYTPESSTTSNTSSSSRSLTFAPVIQVSGSSGDSKSIKQQIMEALEESYSYLGDMYAVEVER